MNHKGLIEMNCTTKTVVRPKAAYYAMQHLTAVVDGNVSAPKLTFLDPTEGLHVSRVDTERQGAPMVFVWINEGMPSGNTTIADAVPLSLNLSSVSFGDPVIVDLVSGQVFPGDGCGNQAKQCTVPLYDAPILLTERAAVPMNTTST